jgi:hypothetical protein
MSASYRLAFAGVNEFALAVHVYIVSNRSHGTSNRVSDAAIRILKIRDQRLASEIGRLRRKIPKITRQRLRDVSLTLGNVARIFANRT